MKQPSAGSPALTHYPDSEPTSICSNSLKLHAKQRSGEYQFYSVWFDKTMFQTHNLPHSRQAHKSLHHRCGWDYIHLYININTVLEYFKWKCIEFNSSFNNCC
jgi:hypothetical protein